MKPLIIILTALSIPLVGCVSTSRPIDTKPTLLQAGKSACGVDREVVVSIISKFPNRRSTDGGYDENDDGKVDHIESVTSWDFLQMIRVLNEGTEHQPYKWTNIDTCYKFEMTSFTFYEDKSKPVVWRTCRTFKYNVEDQHGTILGNTTGNACKNFGTNEWAIL